MQSIVITGAKGQLGQQLLRVGSDQGLPVVGSGSGELDITDAESVRRAVTPDTIVINCAAYTAVDNAETDEAAAFSVNEAGPRTLATVCAEVGARLIHISTDYVFDGTATSPYETDHATGPVTVYGRSKLAGELAVHEILPTASVVRTAWVYTGSGADFVSTMLRLESERDTVSVVDDQIGSPTYSADLAAGLLELAAHPEPPATLHLTNAGQASWFELARAVFAGVGADPERVLPVTSAEFVRPAPRPAYSVLSGKAWSDAGLTPLRPWRDALDVVLAKRTRAPR
jgi:dTDP-4-dehydrorhamnose reductase